MKNLKKLVSVILTVAMLISSIAALSVSATGDYGDVAQDNSYYKAIKVLSGLSIVKGDDEGNFNPKNDIKRSEMVALVCRAVGEEEVAQASGGASFDDVSADHWAAGYIAWGVAGNIINGVGDNKFDPDASVKLQDAIVMLSRALGYARIAERAENGGYPTGYLKVASQRGLMAGGVSSADASKAATREVIAQLIYNAMTAPLVDVSYYAAKPEDDEYTVYDGKNGTELRTLLTFNNEIYKVKATVEATAKTKEALRKDIDAPKAELKLASAYDYAWSEILDGTYKKDATLTAYVGETEVADYLGYTVEAYVAENEDEEWELKAIVVDTKSTTTETLSAADAEFKSYKDGVFKYTTEESSKVQEIDVDENAKVYYNGKEFATDLATANADVLVNASALTFMGPKNGDYNKVFVTDYIYDQVEKVRVEDKFLDVDVWGGIELDAEQRKDETFIYNLYDAKGNAITLEDIQEDDILNIVAPATSTDKANLPVVDLDTVNYMDIYVTNETVEGYVDGDAGDKINYTINGEDYKVINALKLGEEGIFYLTIDGLVYDRDSVSAITRNYSLIVNFDKETKFGESTYMIQMFDAEGVLETYTVASTLKVKVGDADPVNNKRIDGTQDKFFAAGVFADIAAGYKTEALAQAGLKDRLVTFKTNASNEISELRFAAAGAEFGVATKGAATYRDDLQVFGGNDLDENSVLFVAPITKISDTKFIVEEDDLEIASFATLDEDDSYPAYIYQYDNDDYLGAALTYKEISTSMKLSHLAVVKSKGTGLDKDENTVTKYTILQSGEEFTLSVDDEATVAAMTTGDVFRYTTNVDGDIDETELIYDASEKKFATNWAYADYEKNDIAIVYGEITDVENNTMTIDPDAKKADDELKYKMNETEGNTYVSIDETVTLDKNAVSNLSAGRIKASYGTKKFFAVAILGEASRFEDVVMIER